MDDLNLLIMILTVSLSISFVYLVIQHFYSKQLINKVQLEKNDIGESHVDESAAQRTLYRKVSISVRKNIHSTLYRESKDFSIEEHEESVSWSDEEDQEDQEEIDDLEDQADASSDILECYQFSNV